MEVLPGEPELFDHPCHRCGLLGYADPALGSVLYGGQVMNARNVGGSISRRLVTLRIAVVFVAAAAVVLLTGCPAPLEGDYAARANDTVAPSITVTSPAAESSYGTNVVVTGSVSDLTNEGAAGEIKSVVWEVVPRIISGGEAILDGDQFSFSFVAADFTGNISIQITAYDWNDNATPTQIILVEGDPIPSLDVAAGNKQVDISWDEVFGANSYDLLYVEGTAAPSDAIATTIADVTSPYTLDGLSNGQSYTLVLRANSSAGTDESASRTVIPASAHTFAPLVTAIGGSIELSWREATAWDGFVVERAVFPDGEFFPITGEISATRYTDTNVSAGVVYSYRVRPALAGAAASASASGRAYELPTLVRTQLGRADSGGQSASMAVSSDYAFVTTISPFFDIVAIDITNPLAPFQVDSAGSLAGNPYGVAASGNLAYLAQTSRFTIYEVQGSSIVTRGSYTGYDTSGDYALGAAVIGETAYVTKNAGGDNPPDLLVELSVSSPDSPTRTDGSGTTFGDAEAIAIQDGYAYLVGSPYEDDADDTLPTLEIVDLDTFSVVGSIARDDPAAITWYGGKNSFHYDDPIALTTDYAYISASNDTLSGGFYDYAIATVDITTKSTPTQVGYHPVDARIVDLVIAGEDLYASGNGRVDRYALDDPESPALIGELAISGDNSHNVDVNGTYLYVTDNTTNDYTLNVLDVSDLPSMTVAGSHTSAMGVNDLVPYGNGLVGAAGTEGLRTYRVGTEGGISAVDTVTLPGTAAAVEVRDGHAFAAASTGGLAVVPIDDSLSFGTVAAATGSGAAEDVAIRGDAAYVAAGGSGLEVYDISDPEVPTLVDTIATANARAVHVAGDELWLADGPGGIRVYSIATPTSPQLVSQAIIDGNAVDVTREGGRAYVAATAGGLAILDARDLGALSVYDLDDDFALPADALRVTAVGNLVYVACDAWGVAVVEATTATNPQWIGGRPTIGDPTGVAAAGDRIYVSADDGTVAAIDPF